MCNTPKYAKLEERTGNSIYSVNIFFVCYFDHQLLMGFFFSYVMLSGYGGGFNERENVEYIEREESDGEYDEVSVIWYPKIAALMFDK